MIQRGNRTFETLIITALSATVVNTPVATFDVVNKGYLDNRISATEISGVNIGGAWEIYDHKSANLLYFKTLSAGDNVSITQNGSAIQINTFVTANGSDLTVYTTVFSAVSTFTFNIPPNTKELIIEAIGGGGGGGSGQTAGGTNSSTNGGTGGGGGAYAKLSLNPRDLNTSILTLSVGSGGTGAPAGNNGGGAGTDTVVSLSGVELVRARAGSGGNPALGAGGTGANPNGGTGGAGSQNGTAAAVTPAVGGGGGGGGSGAIGIGGGGFTPGTPAAGGIGGIEGGQSQGGVAQGGNAPVTSILYTTGGGGGGGGGNGGGNGGNGAFGGGGGAGKGGTTIAAQGGTGGTGGHGLIRIRAYVTRSGDVPGGENIGPGEGVFAQLSAGVMQFKTLSGMGGTSVFSSTSSVIISSAIPQIVFSYSGNVEITAGESVTQHLFRNLSAGANISLISSASTIALSVGPLGETNTISSVGLGNDITYSKSGTTLRVKSLSAGPNIQILSATDVLTISSSDPGEINTLSSVGLGSDLAYSKSGTTLRIRTLSAVGNVVLLFGTDVLTLSAGGGGGGGGSPNSNIGGATEIAVGGTNNIRTLSAVGNIILLSGTDVITLSAGGSGGGGGGTLTNLGSGTQLAVDGTTFVRTISAGTNVTFLSSANTITIQAAVDPLVTETYEVYSIDGTVVQVGGGAPLSAIGGQISLTVPGSTSIRTLSAGPGIELLSSAQVIAISCVGPVESYNVYDINSNIVTVGRGLKGDKGDTGATGAPMDVRAVWLFG